MSDEREAELAVERSVALLVECFEGREALSKQLPEESWLSWTVARPGVRHDGCRSS